MNKQARLAGILVLIFCLAPYMLKAEPAALSGEVKIEEFGQANSSQYSSQQDEALKFIQSVEDAQKSKAAPTELVANSKVNFYLTGLYLYCLSKSGACPFALDTILVADYYNNKKSMTGCVNMKNLWRTWVENGYEKRVAYIVPLALAQKFSDFQKNQRPRYLRCEETLKTFVPDDNSLKSISLTKKFIEQIKQKNINVLHESGALKAN